ncbi:ABC transporter ATP-binding protein [Arenibacterium sp. LLYu02]|uniref:ABC transporter ATP-binding protein n=1 Tax=Arenibacterium sp. LLYu02 TaxID=3404132 RepID=UPI003B210E86
MTDRDDTLLDVENLVVHFKARDGRTSFPAVDDISFAVRRGRTLGLVGESGCGKSTTGNAILRLVEGQGRVRLGDRDLMSLSAGDMRSIRRRIQIVFQDTSASLDPRMTVGEQLREVLQIHGLATPRSAPDRIEELLGLVGLPTSAAARYPHELSGGQAQRVGICRALAVEPDLIICDEAVSALDVSIQAQVLGLLRDLQERLGLTYIFISHDLSVVRHICHDVAVMYLGRIVEQGPCDAVFSAPQHPYTQALISAVPVPDPDHAHQSKRIALRGEMPDPSDPPSGCKFRTRCPISEERCAQVVPAMTQVRPMQHAACLLTPAAPQA